MSELTISAQKLRSENQWQLRTTTNIWVVWLCQTRDWPIIMFSESVCDGGRHIVVNSFILFTGSHGANNPDDVKCIKEFSLLDFRDELARDLAVLSEYDNPPVYNPRPQLTNHQSMRLCTCLCMVQTGNVAKCAF